MSWEFQLSTWASTMKKQAPVPLRIDLWNGQQLLLCDESPQVIVHLSDVTSMSYLLCPTVSNLGEAYVDGKIQVDGSADALIAVANQLAAYHWQKEGRISRLSRKLLRNREVEHEAIRYHYDVSNEFYQLWLDDSMAYSCAYFEKGNECLNIAQQNKIDHILRKIQIHDGDSLLDLGCGWGSLLIHAAKKYDISCVGVTLSENQAALAKERVRLAGLAGRVEIRLQDYRDVNGCFNKITSVGMFEHVGIQNLPTYFQKIHALLTDDGMVMNHGITTSDHNNGETPFGNGDFIEKYVFPYGQLAHLSTTINSMQVGGLEVYDIENLRRHYELTCSVWLSNFEKQAQQIISMVGEKRYRIWRVYLAGCRYAFEQDWISLYQIVSMKSGKSPRRLPLSRNYIYNSVSDLK